MKSTNTPRATLLVINPDPITTLGIAAVLDLQGYECHCACDVAAARRAIAELDLDLIICDTEIAPAATTLCYELTTNANRHDVPVIYVTGARDEELPTAQSCSTYRLQKPFDPDMLIALVEKAMWMPHLITARLRQPHVQGFQTIQSVQGASSIPAPAAGRRANATEQRR